MTVSDPNNILAGAFANLESGKLLTKAPSSDESKKSEKNEFSVRAATLEDLAMLESIEREAFPGMTPVTRLERDLTRQNGLYLAATRSWRVEEQELGPRYAIATKSEKEDESFTARVKRNLDRYVLDRVARPILPTSYIAGFVGLWFVLDEAHVVTIGLRESDRRQGIGELLLISGIEQAVENDSRVVTLEVRESNEPAIELYRKYGFQDVGLRRRYYSDNGENAVIMTTPPIQSDDYQSQFTTLVEHHADKWGWVSRPGFSAPEGWEADEIEEPTEAASDDSTEAEV
ncbi:MAG: ribosomal protein S18-alanine N-acetyltransferase [Chloroflexi bacterium]|jgi:ribosomal-protein-alanine N-acetyltransferase|nr:ribosomal protein S18-alanine N-acetyltransferase [Chloroflexota bacterium]